MDRCSCASYTSWVQGLDYYSRSQKLRATSGDRIHLFSILNRFIRSSSWSTSRRVLPPISDIDENTGPFFLDLTVSYDFRVAMLSWLD